MARSFDAIVLGAGIVGVSAALHLQARGRAVALVDRRGAAGRETSYGNAGLIERASITPYLLPLEIGKILRSALNIEPDVRYHISGLLEFLPWIARYALHSTAERARRTSMAALPLIERSVSEHRPLAAAAGVEDLLKPTGWIKLFRTPAMLEKSLRDAQSLPALGLTADVLDAAALAEREPHLEPALGALHYRDPVFIVDPAGLAQAYADLFVKRGGALLSGDALGLTQEGRGWSLQTEAGSLRVPDVVAALGPWSNHLLRPLGYKIPLGIKRGYHRHYGTRGNAVLNHPVLDAERGYLLAPMRQGVRMTTGAEFARFAAPPTPVQIAQVEPWARKLFPLADRLEADAWMGRRPCLPDMLPVIGKAPRHDGLWLDFGHQHHGLTLGPATGRLLAEMMTGEDPFTDPAPYRLERFG